jgi:predicted porin
LSDRDASTNTLLIGGELTLSSRLTASLRLGESIRIFDASGKQSSSPYGETTLNYRLGPTSALLWSSRYGFEEPPDKDSEVVTYRSSLTYTKNFTPRFSTSATIYGVYRKTTNNAVNFDIAEETFEASLSLQYRMTRDLTLTGTYSFTKSSSSGGGVDYDRQRIFIGGEYEF